MTSIQEREAAALRALRDRMREQDNKRKENPERNRELERIWVVYAWQNTATQLTGRTRKRIVDVPLDGYQWVLAGFRRRRQKRKPSTFNRFFAKVRRSLGIEKDTELKLVDLNTAMKWVRRGQPWQDIFHYAPPQHYAGYKMDDVAPQEPIVLTERAKTRKVKRINFTRFHKTQTQFIVLGRRKWDRDPTWVYGGPLCATDARSADAEGQAAMSSYADILVLPTSTLSPRLRNMLHSGKRIGIGQRIMWPEPVGVEEILKHSATRMKDWSMRQRDVTLAIEFATAQAKKAFQREQEPVLLHWLTVLTFLHEWEH